MMFGKNKQAIVITLTGSLISGGFVVGLCVLKIWEACYLGIKCIKRSVVGYPMT